MQPKTLRSQLRRHRSSSISMSVPRGMPPALLTRMSTSRQAAATCLICALSVRSAGWVVTVTLCCLRMSSAALSSSEAVRATRCTLHPSAASDFAMAKPMPFDAPVTSALRPVRLRSKFLSPLLKKGRRGRRPSVLVGRATRLLRERIRTQLEVRRQRFRALAAFDQPWRAVAVGGPQATAFPAGVRVVDAAVEALGVEAERIGNADRHHLAVLAQRDETVHQVGGRHRDVIAKAERVVLVDPAVVAR